MQLFLNIWAIVGPLLGIGLGGWLTTRSQRKHWLLDNKRAEYRKLLTTIAEAGSKLIVHYGMEPIVTTGKQEYVIGEIARKSATVIYNRLFIASDVEKLKLQRRWENGISALQKTHDANAFGKAMDSIMDDIRRAAVRDLG